MDQIFIVISGAVITVCFYTKSPVRLSDSILTIIERLGKSSATISGDKKAWSYYARNRK
jgi:hypothetical protein